MMRKAGANRKPQCGSYPIYSDRTQALLTVVQQMRSNADGLDSILSKLGPKGSGYILTRRQVRSLVGDLRSWDRAICEGRSQ